MTVFPLLFPSPLWLSRLARTGHMGACKGRSAERVHPAAACLRIDLKVKGLQRRGKGDRCRPIVPKKLWKDVPGWIALYAERGVARKCWNGCALIPAIQDGRRYDGC